LADDGTVVKCALDELGPGTNCYPCCADQSPQANKFILEGSDVGCCLAGSGLPGAPGTERACVVSDMPPGPGGAGYLIPPVRTSEPGHGRGAKARLSPLRQRVKRAPRKRR
jgi:hypothetical protein